MECDEEMEGKICVIVPAKGDSLKLKDSLNSILNLDYLNFEVIVVDDGLSETGLNVLNEFINKVKIIDSRAKGPSYARNLAVNNTDAKYIAFTDSDCAADKNWLKELLEGFKEYPEAAACGGIQKLPFDAAEFEKKVFLVMKKSGFITGYMRKFKQNRIIEVEHNPSCNVMYRKDVFLQEKGFLEGFWPGEDVELDYRLVKKGYKLVFNPKAVVYHYRPKNLKSFLKMMYRYGKAQGFLVKKYGIFRKIHILPFIVIILLILFVSSVILNLSLMYLGVIVSTIITLIFYFMFDIYLVCLAVLGSVFWLMGFFVKVHTQTAKYLP